MIKFVVRFFGFLVILLCVFAALLAFGLKHIHNSFPEQIRSMLEETMGSPVELESAELNISETEILIRGVQFLNPEGFSKGPLAKIASIRIDFKFESFLVQRIIINKVEVECQETFILRDSSGNINWFGIKAFREGGGFERTGFMAWMNDWPMQIDEFELTLRRTTYIDFTQKPSFTKFILLDLKNLKYSNLLSMMEAVKIITWETLIRLDQGEIQEPFDLFEDKIEAKLGTRKAFLAKWYAGKSSEQLIEETKPSIKASRQPSII